MAAQPDLAINLSQPDQFAQSHTRIMLGLFARFAGILSSKMPFNSGIANLTIDYVTIGQLDAKFAFLSSSAVSARADTRGVLDNLDAIFQAQAKSSTSEIAVKKRRYDELKGDAQVALKTSEDLDASETSIKKNYMQERAIIMESLVNLAKDIAKASKPDIRAHSQDIKNELDKIKERLQRLEKSFNKFETDRKSSNQRLHSIRNQLDPLIPDEQRKAARPAGQAPTPS